jgi:hypothetical protein
MAKPQSPESDESTSRKLAEALDSHCPFGPRFFTTQLRAFISDRCPGPGAVLPELEIHLADGQALDVCHVVALAPAWIAIAVYEPSTVRGARKMRTEIVPYAMIARVTISRDRASGGQLGFDVNHAPSIAVRPSGDERSAERALLDASGQSIA